jgi:histidinol-phosphatase
MQAHHDFLTFGLRLAQLAEAQILPRFRHTAVQHKPDGSEVTDADREAERAMRQAIAARYPDHDVLGEELGGDRQTDKRYRWILDPVDGTFWFALGVPTFGTLIALLEEDDPVVGVIHLPALGETLYAARGEGCWLKSASASPVRVRVAPAVRLANALVSASTAERSDVAAQALGGAPGAAGAAAPGAARAAPAGDWKLGPLLAKGRRFRFVGDCLQHALVCQGRLHASIDPVMKPWDIAAILPCIAEAGGVATSLTGESRDVTWSGSLVTSCSRTLHDELMAALRA